MAVKNQKFAADGRPELQWSMVFPTRSVDIFSIKNSLCENLHPIFSRRASKEQRRGTNRHIGECGIDDRRGERQTQVCPFPTYQKWPENVQTTAKF